jgi:hypothetical protein
MDKMVRIFVEGKADKKFIADYLSLFDSVEPDSIEYILLNGWTNIAKTTPKIRETNDMGGINLVIMDADENPILRKNELDTLKQQHNLEFECFLLPDNQNPGTLETLLCQIIHPKHSTLLNCFENYEECLSQNPDYFTPNLKSKIYAYLEALCPRNQKKFIQEEHRNYQNPEHWDLVSTHLTPLKTFFITHL